MLDLFQDIYVVHHQLYATESVETSFIVVKKEKNHYSAIAEFTSLSDFESSEYAKSSIPVSLVLTGSAVLSKTADKNKTIKDVFPFYSEDAFYFSKLDREEETQWQIIKKKVVKDIQDSSNYSNLVTSLYIVNQLEPTSSLSKFAENHISLIAKGDISGVTDESFKSRDQDFRFYSKWKKYGIYFLLFWLFLLVANFFVFQQVYSKTEVLPAKSVNPEQRIVALRQQINNLPGETRNGTFDFAFLSDQLALKLPKQINLQDLHFNPLVNNNGELSFKEGTVQLVGSTTKTKAVNQYITKLIETKLFTEVELGYIKMLKNKVEFKIDIKL